MKLFEATWREQWNYYERYFDTVLGRSIKKRIDLNHEWYEPSSKGLYSYILDDTIKLDKKQGKSKNGQDQYGRLDPMYRNIRDNYWGKGLYNLEPRVWYLDIETRAGTNSVGFPDAEKALEPISMFQIFDSKEKVVIMLGLREWKHIEDYRKKMEYEVKYIQCTDEINLIETYISLFAKLDPLIIYAWYGDGFDFPYMFNRMKKLGMDTNQLSNYDKVNLKSEEWFDGMRHQLHASGHFYIDLMKVYENFVKEPRASYKLDYIAEVDLKENKVDHSCYSTFDGFYTGNYNIPENPTDEQRASNIYKEAIKNGINDEVRELSHSEFCYYSYKDPLLIKKIDDNRNLTALQIMISEKMGVQIGDATGTVKPWSQYIANKSHQNKQIMPPRKDHPQPDIVGGHVRDPEVGRHKWVLSADVSSMYPLLGMVGFNISSETFVPIANLPPELRDIVLSYFNNQEEENRFDIPQEIWDRTTELLVEHNLALAVNGAVFKSDEIGMIPVMVQDIYNSRKKAKGTMFKYEQRKVLINEILKEKS